MKKKKILILGAGFGGMYTYKNLSKKVFEKYDVTLVDKNNHFLFTPLLHEVATGSLLPGQITEPIRSLINPETEFVQSQVKEIDLLGKKVHLDNGVLDYDILVSSLGSQSNFFGVPGAQEYSYQLKNLADAMKLKNRFIDIFEKASAEKDKQKRKKMLSFVIVGSGPTGVELAGEAADLFFKTFNKYYHKIYCPQEVNLSLVSSSSTVLSMFKEKMRNHAYKKLVQNNVRIVSDTRIVKISENSVETKAGEVIPASTVVWAAGVEACDFSADKRCFEETRKRVHVTKNLHLEKHPEVYILGDMAHAEGPDGKAFPMTAQVAKQQGVYVGKKISQEVLGKKVSEFSYKERGMLASLGNYAAVADLGFVSFTGFTAWFVWRTIYLVNFVSWVNRFKIMFYWFIDLFTERDITRI